MSLRTKEELDQARHRACVATKVVHRVEDFFGGQYGWSQPNCWSISVSKYTELACETCNRTGCNEKPVCRIAVNIWGCIYEIEVCRNHKVDHGMWGESI
jgi:ribosomal protein L37AE/L43A